PGIVLRPALEREEIVVATAAVAGIAAAGGGARRIYGAAALLGVEEAAEAAEGLILLAAHGVFVSPALGGEFCLCLPEAQIELLREPLHVALGERDQRIGAAVAGTFAAVVHLALFTRVRRKGPSQAAATGYADDR